ncbi:MAG TPA: cell division protein ZapE [Hyphomicrobiaceae bacterium]|nr:cell division protein ZapE [Hyphomicrobiaceae bacterium]
MRMGPLERYRGLVSSGEIELDAGQLSAAERLDILAQSLANWRSSQGRLWSLFARSATDAPRGLYIHGAVGRGKTMLMDLFFASLAFQPRRRLHFHEFMAEVHDRIGVVRKSAPGDPIPHVARQIAAKTRLLCFDELHVTDIADAMILGRLFKVLFAEQVVVVATSNVRPSELYRNGLNRQLFLPFVDLIEDHMDILELVAARDFRLEKLADRPLYFTPANAKSRIELDRIWLQLTGVAAAQPTELVVKGRRLHVPLAARGVARFRFADLCEKPLGSLDYLHIARAFHTLLIEGIPVLNPTRRNEARRFINLVDTLYDHRVGLVASADAEPGALYPSGDGADLFQRTASRLMEMRSAGYLASRRYRADAGVLPG